MAKMAHSARHHFALSDEETSIKDVASGPSTPHSSLSIQNLLLNTTPTKVSPSNGARKRPASAALSDVSLSPATPPLEMDADKTSLTHDDSNQKKHVAFVDTETSAEPHQDLLSPPLEATCSILAAFKDLQAQVVSIALDAERALQRQDSTLLHVVLRELSNRVQRASHLLVRLTAQLIEASNGVINKDVGHAQRCLAAEHARIFKSSLPEAEAVKEGLVFLNKLVAQMKGLAEATEEMLAKEGGMSEPRMT